MGLCVFCGATEGTWTKEHVIPKWARRALGVQGSVTIHACDDSSADRTLVGRLHDLSIVLKDRLCPTCNNEWLSGIERKIAPILRPMAVHAQTTDLTPATQKLLAFWAVKTCFLLELAFRQRWPASRTIDGYLATAQEWPGSGHTTSHPRARWSGWAPGTAQGRCH